MDFGYLTHFIVQNDDQVIKVSELAVDSPAHAARIIDDNTARHPNDRAMYALRRANRRNV